MLRIKTFGGLFIHREESRVLGAAAQPRRMAVLAMIARAGPRGVTRDRLQTVLWPDADSEHSAHALKQALYALRRDIGVADLFLGTRDIRLNPDEVQCDVVEFEEMTRRNEHGRAATLYEGPFLDGFRLPSVPEFEFWMEEERQKLEVALANSLEQIADASLASGDPNTAVRWCRRRAALTPVDGAPTIKLMQALLAAGDRAGALQQARIYEGLIAQELDLPPDDRVLELARRIREGRVVPALISAPAPVARSTPPDGLVSVVPSSPRETPLLSVAVLPFRGIARDTDASVFSDGLTEELISALGRHHDLHVPARTCALPDGPTDLAAVGARLGVRTLLEGSVRHAGDALRVIARLLRAEDGAMLWNETYDRTRTEELALQDELARTIAGTVELELRRTAGLPPAPSARDRADGLYMEGMQAWTPQGAGLGQGLDQFRQAILVDPQHARSHAALAESYTQLAFYGFLPAQRAAQLVDAASREAMRLAPHIAESHVARGTCLLWVDRDFAAGTAALERALELDPSSVTAQARLAFVRLCHDGPTDDELATAHRAATGTGATGLARVMYGQQLLAARRYDDAIEALHTAIDIESPSFLAYHWLCVAYVQKGMGAEALGAAVAEASISGQHPWSLLSLCTACSLAGQKRRAETMVHSLKQRSITGHVQMSVLGLAHTAIGDLETGMALLERAVEEHDPSMMMLKTFPMFAPFRAHPRFRGLLHSAGWRDWDTAEFAVPKTEVRERKV